VLERWAHSRNNLGSNTERSELLLYIRALQINLSSKQPTGLTMRWDVDTDLLAVLHAKS